ncbi:UNVERIFIED_CONTAM: protein disulfide isomerase-like 1-4 [Sesamum radiatum]|uniref:Protein disulfide isomerase-like 1-4 n=1 Tax=Sesamum radiatum TaxID=300843 RepID=A0AAW2W447_SESRA
MAPTRLLLLRTLLSLLLFSLLLTPILSDAAAEDDEDLNFLEELESEDVGSGHQHYHSDAEYSDNDGEEDENYDDFEVPSDFNHQDEEDEVATFDEEDVVVLTGGNFSDFVDENKYVMVEFYAPWCVHCKALAPEYAEAATELKGENVKLAKVDVSEENDLAEQYEVQGYPTVYFFVDGEHKPYSGHRTKDAIVTWIKKKIGPGVSNITTTEDAERILTSENKVVLGFLDTLVLIFVYVQVDNEEVGKPVADYFGVAGDSPKVLGYAANDETKKYVLDGEVTLEKIKADGFPTILFFPAGKKSVDPITVDTDRTVVAFYKFLKKHASIPFKLQKAGSSPTSEDSHTKEGIKSSTSDVKDEL